MKTIITIDNINIKASKLDEKVIRQDGFRKAVKNYRDRRNHGKRINKAILIY